MAEMRQMSPGAAATIRKEYGFVELAPTCATCLHGRCERPTAEATREESVMRCERAGLWFQVDEDSICKLWQARGQQGER